MQTNIGDKHVLMKLRGLVAELIVRVALETHSDYVMDENSKPILYVELPKALCGILNSALKFYIKVVEDLREEGFEINPYDGCVANRIVHGKHQNASWHVDDLKLSHTDPTVNHKLIEKLRINMKQLRKEA